MSEILKRLYEDEIFSIPELKGDRTIFYAKNIFSGGGLGASYEETCKGVRPSPDKWRLDGDYEKTGKMEVAIYEIIADRSFQQILESLPQDIDDLSFNGNQIIDLCENSLNCLAQLGVPTFFLAKKKGEFIIISVRYSCPGSGLCVGIESLDSTVDSFYGPHLIIPKIF